MQTCQALASRNKRYIVPRISITAVETTHLLAASGPEANVQDINYGGELTDEIDDQ
ncbi:hypothetical protein [Prevotella pallens]|jgi:hypothetical protein|uniref:hypothetical protein n=1 Tax=Prevotella pallens TaxID=60133 RepID=UPI001CB20BD9|nr:hypothetical protein [Prevotella pallens]MBF1486084.1 hypothetical protein [Prevotella pallens]MBF1493272.1 hypothetical protein [Prevotella pallens]